MITYRDSRARVTTPPQQCDHSGSGAKTDMTHRWSAVAMAAVGALPVAACAAGESGRDGDVTVFAAASLAPVSRDLATAFEQEQPGKSVTWNFAGSPDLLRQIKAGAPADVFISADEATMDRARTQPDFSDSAAEVIAQNTLVLAIAPGNPAGVSSLHDLSDARVALCAPEVPCGTGAHRVLQTQGVELRQPTEEPDVAAVSAKVATGDVDAGFVYSTDARALASRGVTRLDLGEVEPNRYPLALTARGVANPAAGEFAAWMQGDSAQEILRSHGFTSEEPAP